MSVREHKTGSEGSAINDTSRDLPKLEGHINHIGPLIDPQHKIDRLLVLSGPRELMNVHSYIQAVGKTWLQCSLFYKGEKDWINNSVAAVWGG